MRVTRINTLLVILLLVGCDSGGKSPEPTPPSFTATVTPTPTPPVDVAMSPASLPPITIEQNTDQSISFSISNNTPETIDYRIDFLAVTNPEKSGANPLRTLTQQIPYIELKKGEKDPRQGQPVIHKSGGPDTFGYNWVDSNDPMGPTFHWQDITETGTLVTGLSDEAVVEGIPIGFSFPFYGEKYTHLNINSNGFISFSPIPTNISWVGEPLPNTDDFNNLIAWMWTDLEPEDSSVYYQLLNDGRFVLQFNNYKEFSSESAIDAQVILDPNGNILLQYLDYRYSGYRSMPSIGIENIDGSDGLQVAFSESYLEPELAVFISSNKTSWVEADEPIGQISSGQTKAINLRYRGDTEPGQYLAQMHVKTSSDQTPLIEKQVSLAVAEDTTPPAAVSDLRVFKVGFKDVTLNWTSIANSQVFGGPIDHFELRYSTKVITEENWTTATRFEQVFSPKEAGESETVTITELVQQTQYYFAVRSFDQANNASVLSNIVQVQTLKPPVAATSTESFTLNMVEGNTDTIHVTLKNRGDAELIFDLNIRENIQTEKTEHVSSANKNITAKQPAFDRKTTTNDDRLSRKPVLMQTLPSSASYREQEIIVRFKPGISATQGITLLEQFGGTKIKSIPALNMEVWKLSAEGNMLKTLQLLHKHRSVIYAEPNYTLTANALPNDPDFTQLWGLQNLGQTDGKTGADINAVPAWDQSTGSKDVIVAIIDSGVDYLHPDLVDNMWVNTGEIADNGIDDDGNGFIDDIHGYNFFDHNGNPMDDNNHGTHCAGTIGATGDNGIGVTGVNHQVRLMAVKFLGSWGGGSTDSAIESVLYAVDNGAHILSNSWGGGMNSSAMRDAIEYAQANNVLFVAAAGNSAWDNDILPVYPSSYDLDNVVSVAASDHNDDLASFSHYGLTSVDLAAPGVDIFSTVPNDGYTSFSGTSMAAPHVAGVAALLKAYNPKLTALEIKAALLEGTDAIDALKDRMVSGGRLNAKAALDIAGPNWIQPPKLASATVPGGSEIQLALNINSVKVEVGEYAADLLIKTNDPENPQLVIPVTLTITDDGVAPAAITDLSASNTDERSTEISFTATGDDGNTGTPHQYDLRYSLSEITADNWQNATPLKHSTSPQEAGTTENIIIGGLPATSKIWIAAQAVDFGGLKSEISNVISLTTLNAQLDISPTTLPLITLKRGEKQTVPVTLTNVGEADLHINVGLYNADTEQSPSTSQYITSRKINKGERDYRVGPPVTQNKGGPDNFSNHWIDSHETGGPVFQWNDISNSGTPLSGLQDDNLVGPIDLGFEFPFYGEKQNTLYVSSNGFITFSPISNSGCCAGQPLPAKDHINHLIAWLWYDLYPGLETSVFYEQVNAERFVLQFSNYGEWGGSGTINAQVILESTGEITLQYTGIENNMHVATASIGIENRDGTDGLQVAFNTEYVENALAVTFIPGWLAIDKNQVHLESGQSEVVNFSIDSTDLKPGGYSNTIRFLSNDIWEANKQLGIELEITEP